MADPFFRKDISLRNRRRVSAEEAKVGMALAEEVGADCERSACFAPLRDDILLRYHRNPAAHEHLPKILCYT